MYGQNADARAGVLGQAAGGIVNSNMTAAQGATQAASQFWNGLMSMAGNIAKGPASKPDSGKPATSGDPFSESW